MFELKKMTAPLRKDWKCTALFAVAFAFACWQSARQIRSELGGAAALLILLACLLWQAAKAAEPVPAKTDGSPWRRLAGWLLIAVAFALVLLPRQDSDSPGLKFGAWFFLSLGAVCLFCGVRTMLLGAAPLFGCFLVVPFREQIVLYLSSPFRMASTVFSVGFLRMLGMQIENDMTTIRIEEMDIAVTDACSGIQQFEAMVLVAFLLVMVWRRPFVWRCVHYAFLVPAIIFANAIRIILSIILCKAGFNAILNNAWHEGLGYAQVVLTVAFLFLVGCLLPEAGGTETDDKKAAAPVPESAARDGESEKTTREPKPGEGGRP